MEECSQEVTTPTPFLFLFFLVCRQLQLKRTQIPRTCLLYLKLIYLFILNFKDKRGTQDLFFEKALSHPLATIVTD